MVAAWRIDLVHAQLRQFQDCQIRTYVRYQLENNKGIVSVCLAALQMPTQGEKWEQDGLVAPRNMLLAARPAGVWST